MQYDVPMLGEVMFWMSGISLIFVLLTCWGVKDVDNAETFARLPKGDDKQEEEKVSIKDMWSVLKDNRNVQMYMLAGVSDKLAQQVMGTGIVSTLLAGVLIQSYAANTMVGNISQIVAMFLIVCLTSGGVEGMTKFGVMGVPLVLYALLNLGKTGTIALIGYTTTVPQQGDPATWPVFWAAMFLNFGLPVLGWICNLIAMKFYTLDKERMIEVQKNLNARREAAGINVEADKT